MNTNLIWFSNKTFWTYFTFFVQVIKSDASVSADAEIMCMSAQCQKTFSFFFKLYSKIIWWNILVQIDYKLGTNSIQISRMTPIKCNTYCKFRLNAKKKKKNPLIKQWNLNFYMNYFNESDWTKLLKWIRLQIQLWIHFLPSLLTSLRTSFLPYALPYALPYSLRTSFFPYALPYSFPSLRTSFLPYALPSLHTSFLPYTLPSFLTHFLPSFLQHICNSWLTQSAIQFTYAHAKKKDNTI